MYSFLSFFLKDRIKYTHNKEDKPNSRVKYLGNTYKYRNAKTKPCMKDILNNANGIYMRKYI